MIQLTATRNKDYQHNTKHNRKISEPGEQKQPIPKTKTTIVINPFLSLNFIIRNYQIRQNGEIGQELKTTFEQGK